MPDKAKPRGDLVASRMNLLAPPIGKLVQQLADVQRRVATICRFLPQYRSKPSSNIQSVFEERFRCLLESATENVQFPQRVIESFVTKAGAFFEHIFQTSEPELAKRATKYAK